MPSKLRLFWNGSDDRACQNARIPAHEHPFRANPADRFMINNDGVANGVIERARDEEYGLSLAMDPAFTAPSSGTPRTDILTRPEPGQVDSGSLTPETSTRSGLRTALDQKRRIEQEELVSDVLRLRWLSVVGAIAWLAFALQDWMVAAINGWGRLSWFLGVRVIGLIPIGLAFWRLRNPRGFTRRSFLAFDIGIFCIIQAGLTSLCLEYGGISSRYFLGVLVGLIARTSALAAPWQRGVAIIGVPLCVFPVFMMVASFFVPELRAQFSNAADRSIFIQSVFVSAAAGAICVWGGHGAWAIRRQLFETRSIGKYRLKKIIGRGGMGEVWEAYHSGLHCNVALKILRPDQDTNPEVVQRFEQEVAAMCRLTHPNTVRVFDYGITEDGIWYYAMELLEGQTLLALVTESGRLGVDRALHIVHQVSRALAEAHANGIVHRDVKPENVFITQAGGEPDFVKVLDFGIAKLSREAASTSITRTGAIFGTPTYMSPEAAKGMPMDARSDVYGLGAVLYYLLAGHPPFQSVSATELLMAHVAKPPTPLTELPDVRVPRAVDELVLRCLAKDPADRFPDAAHVAQAIVSVRQRVVGADEMVCGIVSGSAIASTGKRRSSRPSSKNPTPEERFAQSLDARDRLGALLLGQLEHNRRITLGDAIRAAAKLGLDDGDALAAVERLARPQTEGLHRFYVDRSRNPARIVGYDEVRELAGKHSSDRPDWVQSVEVVWSVSEADALFLDTWSDSAIAGGTS